MPPAPPGRSFPPLHRRAETTACEGSSRKGLLVLSFVLCLGASRAGSAHLPPGRRFPRCLSGICPGGPGRLLKEPRAEPGLSARVSEAGPWPGAVHSGHVETGGRRVRRRGTEGDGSFPRGEEEPCLGEHRGRWAPGPFCASGRISPGAAQATAPCWLGLLASGSPRVRDSLLPPGTHLLGCLSGTHGCCIYR